MLNLNGKRAFKVNQARGLERVDPVTNKSFWWDLGAGQLPPKEKFDFKRFLRLPALGLPRSAVLTRLSGRAHATQLCVLLRSFVFKPLLYFGIKSQQIIRVYSIDILTP